MIKYCVFEREDLKVWQGLAGGGEEGEKPIETALREANEEASIPSGSKTIQLSTTCSIPVEAISGFIWGPDVIVIPEYSFGVELDSRNVVKLGDEHLRFDWMSYENAHQRLNWDSNRTALRELNYRLPTPRLTICQTPRTLRCP